MTDNFVSIIKGCLEGCLDYGLNASKTILHKYYINLLHLLLHQFTGFDFSSPKHNGLVVKKINHRCVKTKQILGPQLCLKEKHCSKHWWFVR